MKILIWGIFLAGAYASWYFFGSTGSFVYFIAFLLVINLFRKQVVIGLTHLVSKLGFTKETIDRMPMSINLVKAAAMDDAARPVTSALAASGFVDAGAWDITEMPQIKLALMVHPGDKFFAAIETASAIGAQVNIHTLYSNGNVMTFTNSRLPAPKAQRPGYTGVRLPGASPSALLSKARKERLRDGISAVTVEEAPRLYERLYTEFISYRKLHGA